MTYQILLDIVIGTLTHDVLRYLLGAGGVYVLINVALAGPLRNRKIRPDSPGWPQIRRELAASLRTVLVFAIHGIFIGIAATYGWMRVYTDVAVFGWGWFVASTVLIIVAHDAWFYWTHRIMHRPRFFRLLHRLHHKSHNPTPFTSYSFDIGEAVINAVYLPLFMALVPMHPSALLIFLVHMMLRNALAHCGYEVFPARRDGRPLFGWMTTVTHHDQHHANARYNHGFYFTWWDRWMGTEHPDYLTEFARVARPLRLRGGTVALVALALAALPATAPRAEPLTGTYVSPGLALVVRFDACDTAPEETCGRLLWAWDTTRLRHVKPGQLILSGLRQEGPKWTGGQLIQPETGRIFRGSVRKTGAGDLELRGCAGPICDRQAWRALENLRRELSRLH